MSTKHSVNKYLKPRKKSQQLGPYIIGAVAVVLVLVGIVILVSAFSGKGGGLHLFATKTPTPTITSTPTITPSPTMTFTPTELMTATPDVTATASGPFEYTVQEGDTCYDIAVKYDVDLMVLLAINNFGSSCPIKVGDKIFVPAPGQELDTPTPVPASFRGDIDYTIQPGDTLAIIAQKFNSTVDAILTKNKLESTAVLYAGDVIKVPVNIATPVPTVGGTPTPSKPAMAPSTSTPTKTKTS